MSNKTIKALLLAMLCAPCAAYGGETVTLSHLYDLAEQQSVSMQAYKTGIESAGKEIEIAKNNYLPNITGELSIGYLGDGVLSDRKFNNWQHIDNPHYMNNFALKAEQVLYAGGAIRSGVDMAQLGEQMAELDYQKNRQEIRFMIASCYLDLCRLQNRRQVIEKNIELTAKIIDNIKSKYDHGTALKTDITRYELQMEQLRLQLTKIDDARTVTSSRLAIMLHMPTSTMLEADFQSVNSDNRTLSLEQWQDLSAGNNDLRQAELATDINRQKLRLEKSERLPKVAAFAALQFDGPITVEVPVLNKNICYWYAGVGISYNFSSLYKNNKNMAKAKINLAQSQLQRDAAREQVSTAVKAAYTDYLTAYKELDTQRKSVVLADENYAVVSNRYDNGLALLTDMLDASSAKLSADLSAVDAEINIIYNYFKLKYICHSL